MMRLRSWFRGLMTMLTVSVGAVVHAQATYTFTSGPAGDGFIWDITNGVPNDLPDSFGFETPDGVEFVNFTNADAFFTDGYTAATNSTVIDGEALWGNPDVGTMDVLFFNTANGGVQNVSFDFAWANIEDTADPFLYVELFDIDGDSAEVEFEMESSFDAGATFNNSTGWEGAFFASAADLLDSDENPLDDIVEMYISAGDVTDKEPQREFAIDNFGFDTLVGGSNVFPSVNNGAIDVTGSIIVANQLVNTGIVSMSAEVTNNGTDPTTYSTALVPGGDLTDAGQVSGAPIDGGETDFTPTILTFDSNTLSGEYNTDVQIINDTDPTDPTDTFTRRVRIHDAPSLSDNSPVQVDLGVQLELSNAAAGPHAGAVRAGVRVTGTPATTGPFTVTGFDVGDTTLEGETDNAAVAFDRFGRLNGVYNGTHTVDLEMVSQNGFFLNGAAAVPSQTWDLAFDLQTISTDLAALTNGDSFDRQIGVNSATIAATLIAGTTSTDQNVSLEFVANPSPISATVVGESVDLTFDNPGDLYVMQFTYDEVLLAGGLVEDDLQLLFFDTGTGNWDEAIAGNSDAGAGGTLFAGSFADYLAGPGGGTLDLADLSDFGVDTAANQIWAVLDHATIFAAGVLGFRAADFNEDTFVDGDDLLIWKSAYGISNLADADGDGDTDGADFLVWQRQLDPLPPSSATPVAAPEPTSAALLIGFIVGAIFQRQATRRQPARYYQ